MMLMLLGTYSVSSGVWAAETDVKQENQAVQDTKASETVSPAVSDAVKEDDIKANKETLENAEEAMVKKDYKSAISLLNAYIDSKPKKYEAYKLRGDSYYAMRQYKLARDDYQKAIELKTSDDKFLTGTKVLGALVLGADKDEQYQNPELGELYGRLMYAQKAMNSATYESSYQKAVSYNSHIYLPKPKKEDIAKINCPQKYGKLLDPQGVDKYVYGAIEDIENGHYNEAVYKVKYVTSNYPQYYFGYYLTGVSLAGMDKTDAAVDAFKSALKYNPNDFESLASLGQIYYREAEKTFSPESAQKSIEYFKSAIKLNPNCYIYYYYTGLNYLLLGEYELAVNNFNSAIKFKANDYNSRYYKLIAQYILGDYSSVIDGTTRLLYRHVSNYNSVLYLRALAEYKQGYFDDALADIEKVHINMNDIYNADVKKLSAKEKTLDSYLYYLKSKIMYKKGFGVKADFQKAVQNPIIANLSRVEKAVAQYTKNLDESSVSIEDYNKYRNFYDSQVESLLDKNLVITIDDVDNQYDYIRTTFDNLGLTFEYIGPNYKLTTIDNYAYKKYGLKLPQENKESVSEGIQSGTKTRESSELKQSTDPSETLAGDKSSIALMLASHSLTTVQDDEDDIQVNQNEPVEVIKVQQEEENISPAQNTAKESSEKLAQSEPSLPVLRPEAKEVSAEEISESSAEVKENNDTNGEVQESQNNGEEPQPIIIEAPVQKQTDTFEIIHTPVSETKEPAGNTISEPVKDNSEESVKSIEQQSVNIQQKEEKPAEEVSSERTEQLDEAVPPEKPQTEELRIIQENEKELNSSVIANENKSEVSKVVEKHANVNLNNFDRESKVITQIPDGEEVVVLEPDNFISQAEKKISPANTGFKNPNKVTDNFAAARRKAANSADIQNNNSAEQNLRTKENNKKVNTPSMLAIENTKQADAVLNQKAQTTAAAQEVEEDKIEAVSDSVKQKQEVLENVSQNQEQNLEIKSKDSTKKKIKNEESAAPENVEVSMADEMSDAAETTKQEEKKGNWFTSLFKKEQKEEDIVTSEPENISNAENIIDEKVSQKEQAEDITQKPQPEPITNAEKSISSIVQSTFLGETLAYDSDEDAVSKPEEANTDKSQEVEKDTMNSVADLKEENISSEEDEVEVNETESQDAAVEEENKVPWYKRIFTRKNKKAENGISETKLEETIQEVKEEPLSEQSEIDKILESTLVDQSILSANIDNNAPKIRTEKAEVESDAVVNISDNKEKKKFTWWWQKDKKDKQVKEKSKFSWKKLFTRKKNKTEESVETQVKQKKVIKELQKTAE